MPGQSIESRVEVLEARVTMHEELPARMDRLESQIMQLRAENSEEHSALRRELVDLGVRMERLLDERFAGVGARMEQLLEEQKRHTGVLFEEALSRIAAMNDARPRPSSRRRKN